MSKTIKLSPAMQKMVWRMFNERWIANENLPADLRNRGSNPSATRVALRDRGIIEYVRYDLETGEAPHYRITEAGHAWIAEQIDTAHTEALRQNVIYTTDETYGSERYVAAWRAYAMTGRIECPREIVERDHAQALGKL